ncbi:hypothetical protein BDZ89DRAFT_955257, partial [Hymenopellis radicata]
MLDDVGEHERCHLPSDTFTAAVRNASKCDSLLGKILDNPDDHRLFHVEDGLVWYKRNSKENALCLPTGGYGEQSIRGLVIEQAHRTLGHYGAQRTSEYVRRWYWW